MTFFRDMFRKKCFRASKFEVIRGTYSVQSQILIFIEISHMISGGHGFFEDKFLKQVVSRSLEVKLLEKGQIAILK